MGDSHSWKPGTRSGSSPTPTKPTAAGSTPAASDADAEKAGRIVHDERGNAVWDWLKDTARTAIDSTSRLLRKLEVPDLKIEDTHEQELRVESDRDSGGGYDPYGGSPPAPGRAGNARGSAGSAGSRGSATNSSSARGTTNNTGGGYDPYGGSGVGGGYNPYGKSATNKPPRKP